MLRIIPSAISAILLVFLMAICIVIIRLQINRVFELEMCLELEDYLKGWPSLSRLSINHSQPRHLSKHSLI